jgi:hypothetical protein
MSSSPVSVAVRESAADPELHALSTISSLLADLSEDSQARIVTWISSRFHVQGAPLGAKDRGTAGFTEAAKDFSDVATLFIAANPSTGSEKALTVAFWLQEYLHHDEWEGFAINTELKHLGHGLKNVTDALNALIEHRPQLVVQVRKSGKTKQARKRYKLTVEGIRRARQMVCSVTEV